MNLLRVALDVPLALLFDYALPETLQATLGDRVVVPFGTRQRLGIVAGAASESEIPAHKLRPIASVRDDAPRLSPEWLELMRLLAGYYQRPLGETMIAALPPRLRSVRPLPRKSLSAAPLATSPRFVPTHTL